MEGGSVTFPPLITAKPQPDFGGSPPPRGRGTGRRQAFLTGVDEKQSISFGDSPKARGPKTKPADGYIPQASSQSQNTTKLLQKRRKNNEWQQALEMKREEFAKRMAECDARQAELKKKCKDLRKRVQLKEQEVQETRSKIDRATKKQDEERHVQAEKELEIAEKQLEVQHEEETYAKLIAELDRTNQYKQFLDQVCEENEGYFDEVDAILRRYDSLSETSKEQSDRLIASSDLIEGQRDSLSKYSKATGNDLVEKNASIAQGRKVLDSILLVSMEAVAGEEKLKMREQKGIMDIGSIEMAVDNLHTRCFLRDCELSKAQAQEIERIMRLNRKDKTAQMLERLSIFYQDMDYISKYAKSHPKKEEKEESPTGRGRRGEVHASKGNGATPRVENNSYGETQGSLGGGRAESSRAGSPAKLVPSSRRPSTIADANGSSGFHSRQPSP